jgi:hypothetical protein
MLDLETMSTKPNAAIVAIGAVVMNFEENYLGAAFYRVVSLSSSMEAGLVVDSETIMWWMKQADFARKVMQGCDTSPLTLVLTDFANFLRYQHAVGEIHLWGNGAAFDNVVLRSAYEATKVIQPWDYRGDRCYRTMRKEYPEVPYPDLTDLNLIPHNALDDAKAQAYHLLAIKNHIKKGHSNG